MQAFSAPTASSACDLTQLTRFRETQQQFMQSDTLPACPWENFSSQIMELLERQHLFMQPHVLSCNPAIRVHCVIGGSHNTQHQTAAWCCYTQQEGGRHAADFGVPMMSLLNSYMSFLVSAIRLSTSLSMVATSMHSRSPASWACTHNR